jgi:L-ascorbate metabolism protein UlaG (beta-lactamase superfamily)
MRFKILSVCLSALVIAACASEPVGEPDDGAAAQVSGAAAAGAMLSGDHIATESGDLVIQAISHATFAMGWDGKTIYVDPVGGAEAFDDLPTPDLVLITDIHGDHLNAETLEAVVGSDTVIIAPAAVVEQLPESLAAQVRPLANGAQTALLDLTVDAIPMYNLTEDRLGFHEQGRGNGYVVTAGGTRVYISGDTEDIPEMRALEDIDVAFVCFNLPYTMTEEQAADAVNEFQPRIVYPYHYMGSDVDLFTSMVDDGIEVRIGGWY